MSMRTFFRQIFFTSFLACLLVTGSFFTDVSVVQAFGISPPTLTINAARGTRITAEVLLQKDISDLNKDVSITVKTSSDPLGVVTLEGQGFVIPAGQLQRMYPVRALIGQDVPNGEHRVKVVFLLESASSQGAIGGTSAATAASSLRRQLPLVLKIAVSGQQVTSIEFISAKIPPLESDDPMLLQAEFKNTGNVSWKPDAVLVRIYREDDPTKVVFEYTAPVTEYIDPSMLFEYDLVFPHTLGQGRYFGKAFAIEGGKPTQERPIAPFEILAPDTLAKKLEVISVTPDKETYSTDEQQTVEVAVMNTGAVRTSMTVTTSLYKDGVLLSTQVSDPQFVEKGETSLTRVVFKDLAPGNYEVRAYADYSGKTTPILTHTFVIKERPALVPVQPTSSLGVISALPGIVAGDAVRSLSWFQLSMCLCIPYWLLLLILLLLLIAYLLYRYLKRRWNEVIEEHVREAREQQQVLPVQPVAPVVIVEPPAPLVQTPAPKPVPPQPTQAPFVRNVQPLPPIEVDTALNDEDKGTSVT